MKEGAEEKVRVMRCENTLPAVIGFGDGRGHRPRNAGGL